MFKKVLVCLDGSKLAEVVLPFAIEEAKHFGSELVLFRAYSEPIPISLALPGVTGAPIETKGREKRLIEDEGEAEIYLKSLADRLQIETKLTVNYGMALGVAGPAIIEYCVNQGIELIAIATHGRSGLGRLVLGSVADYVIRHSNIPLLVVRPTGDKT
ncbi:MAG: universal stress protein [Dehalococcoidales bacterium]|nr:universal stress protein [Dehalococcoidales bacterium]